MHPLPVIAVLSPGQPGVLSLAIFTMLVFMLAAILLSLSRWIGSGRPSQDKSRPYESGVIPTGSARMRYPVPFYLVAIFFLIFDVEGAFIFAWAAAVRDTGWAGWLEMAFFILMLMFGLIYVWREGGLAWMSARQQP